MKLDAQAEVCLIEEELNKIARELDSVADGLRRNFCGLGTEIAADKMEAAARQYRKVRKILQKIDTSDVTEEYLEKHGG